MLRSASWWHAGADALCVLAAFTLAHFIRFESGLLGAPLGAIPLVDWLTLGCLSLPLWLLIAALHGLYYSRLKQAPSLELGSLTHAVAEGLLATILLTFSWRGLPDSRLALLLTIALAWLLLAGYRLAWRKLSRRQARAAVLGESPVALYMARQLGEGHGRYDLALTQPSLAGLDASALAELDAVFLDAELAAGLWALLPPGPAPFETYLLPQTGSEGAAALGAVTVEGVPALAVKSAADLAVMRAVKRVVDILGASTLVLLTSPFWLMCILGIGLTMPGPLFFTHERLGLGGRRFRLLKFRSMVRDAHKLQANLAGFDEKMKLERDPRITPFGRVLRKLSLDELPQLLNILRGELSLVGPRPIIDAELAKYGPWGGLLTTVPPGLTGLWQVSGRSATTYQQRIDFDLYYINNWSLGLDLLILARTIPAVLSRKGAY
jgi:exopolysaccharide biosynthesis polyprenyl glycosylphosphotransferase